MDLGLRKECKLSSQQVKPMGPTQQCPVTVAQEGEGQAQCLDSESIC